ncbi:MAG: hypothetical protein LBB67_05760 [Oscillospiraceae bacterium]|jgi:hypothetical protein|nr:hypothetical protein [Oscillospiraceae bacterium]
MNKLPTMGISLMVGSVKKAKTQMRKCRKGVSMVRNEYIRYFKSKSSIFAFLLLTALSIPSILSSLKTKSSFLEVTANPEPGLSASGFLHMEQLIKNYTGFRIFFDFSLLSEFYTYGYFLVFMAFIGIVLAHLFQTQKENGFGNLIVTRSSVKKQLKSMLTAQTLYITTLVFASIAAILALCLAIGGVEFDYLFVGNDERKLPFVILFIIMHTTLVSLYLSMVNAISALLNVYIRNRLVLQLMPLCGFTLLPFVLCSTIANLFPPIGTFLIPFVTFEFSTSIENLSHRPLSAGTIAHVLMPIVMYAVFAVILYWKSIKKHTEDYL